MLSGQWRQPLAVTKEAVVVPFFRVLNLWHPLEGLSISLAMRGADLLESGLRKISYLRFLWAKKSYRGFRSESPTIRPNNEAFDAQCSIRISNVREIWLITSMTLTECRPIAQPVSLRKGQLFGMDSQEHCESKHGFESETVTHCTACLPGTLYLLELLNFGAGFKIHWSLDMISMGDIGRMLSFELSVFGV